MFFARQPRPPRRRGPRGYISKFLAAERAESGQDMPANLYAEVLRAWLEVFTPLAAEAWRAWVRVAVGAL